MSWAGGSDNRRPNNSDASIQRRHRPDYWLLLIIVILTAIGLIVLYAISPGLAVARKVGDNYYVNKQLISIGLGIVAFVALSNIPIKFWQRMQRPLLIAAALAAIMVRLFGERVNGAYRWIQIAGISFQAAELIKFALLIWLASFLVIRIQEGNLGDFKKTLQPLLIALGAIGLVVGVIQSDFGSTAVMVAMMVSMTFIAGMPMKRIMLVGGVIGIGLLILISGSSYRRDRLLTFMHPERDCQNTGYQVCQALITVGSGGVFGLGVANSVQAYGYLPEAANDSIFAIFAEKFGFLGVTALIALFVAFFRRLLKIAERAPDDYSRLLVVGIIAWLSTQVLINVGAMMGLLPLKGITLPFISSGGTSLIFVLGALGLVFQISRYTGYRATTVSSQTVTDRKGRANESAPHWRGNRRAHNAAVSRRSQA
ncbi:MAG: putative peptidoglycan glycosyltransferase FtsW [Candidatus Saccharimonadales bacterium]